MNTPKECNPNPNAPHGYLRQASHDAGRYVCECEWWDEKNYELATLEQAQEFEEKRNCTYEWNGVSPAVNALYTVKYEWDNWKAIDEYL